MGHFGFLFGPVIAILADRELNGRQFGAFVGGGATAFDATVGLTFRQQVW